MERHRSRHQVFGELLPEEGAQGFRRERGGVAEDDVRDQPPGVRACAHRDHGGVAHVRV
ncbi:hypothetical protein COSO111634_26380 [Corallococcus soli]